MSDEQVREDLPAVPKARKRLRCPHCDGEDISRSLPLGLSNEVGTVGIKYNSSGKFLGLSLRETEPLRVIVCQSCGTVVRMYVAEPQRDWCRPDPQ